MLVPEKTVPLWVEERKEEGVQVEREKRKGKILRLSLGNHGTMTGKAGHDRV